MDLNKLLKTGVEQKASDLHLTVGLKPSLRIEGELVELSGEPKMDNEEMKSMVHGLLDDKQQELFQEKGGFDIGYQTLDGTRFRINVHKEKGNFGLVARIIPPRIPSMEEIEAPSVLYDMIREQAGLILVTGPSGCGKSTTLAAMIEHVNQERKAHIVTLEDPIEFVHKPTNCIIKQRQYGSDFFDFAEGLKQALRQDPNVIMVGEMRDLPTISTTITVAETGHLVFATLHTYDAAQTIDRIIDIFPPYQQNQVRMQLSMVLKAIVSQRLLPTVEGVRMAVREILINTPAIANLIRQNKAAQIKNVIQTHSELGMISLDQAINQAYQAEKISKETAVAYMEDMKLLQS